MRAFYKGPGRWLVAAILGLGATTAQASRNGIEQELAPLLAAGQGARAHFQLRGCGVPTADITRFVLMGTPSTHELRFSPGCDVEGSFPLDTRPVPIDIRIRHLGRIIGVRGLLSSEPGPVAGARFGVTLHLDDGQLILKGHAVPAAVTAEYALGFPGVLNLSEPTAAGGMLRVSSFDGEPVRFKARLTVESGPGTGLNSSHVRENRDAAGCDRLPECYGRVRAR